MSRTLTSSLIVRLIDQVTGPARSISKSILGIQDAVRSPMRAGGGFMGGLGAAIERNNAALDEARGRLFDAAAGFYALRTALSAPLTSAMNLEATLSGIGSKAGISADQLAAIGREARTAGSAANQTTADMLASIDYLVGMGLSAEDAMRAVGTIGIAATATKGSITDISQAGYAAMANLKVPADQVGAALDYMALAGKRGGFELKDMAQYFPQVGAAYQALGQTGTGAVADLAAAMQVMRMDTGDASTAATNLQNVLQKVYAPATIKKFADKGIDIFKEMEKAAERGLTPIEAIAEITNEALDGDLSKIGFIFEDAQAQAGVRSMIQHMEKFRDIRAEALGGAGTNQADFNRAMQTTEQRVKRAQIAMQNMGTAIGSALLPIILELERILTPVLTSFTEWADKHQGIVGAVVAVTAAFVGLRVAMSALAFVGLMGRGGVLSALSLGMATVGRGAIYLRNAAAAAIALQTALAGGAVIPLLSKIAIGFGGIVTAISAPIWGTFAAIAAAIASAGLLVWKYWDRITAIMSGVGQAIWEILAPAIEKVRPYFEWLAPIGDVIAAGWDRAKAAISAVGDWLGSLFSQETLSEDDKAAAKQAGYDFVMAIWDGMKAVASAITGWVKNTVNGWVQSATDGLNSLAGWAASKGIGSVGNAPAGAPNRAAAINGERAKGGPISRGGRYIVGEEGPELITASRSGYVNPTGSTGAAAPVIQLGGITINAGSASDAMEIARQVRREIEASMREAFREVYADTGMQVY